MMFLWLAATVLACSSSSKAPAANEEAPAAPSTETETETAAEAETEAQTPATRAGAAKVPQFADRLTPDRFPEARGPGEARLLRWDFRRPRDIGYQYHQQVEVEDSDAMPSMTAKGRLIIKVGDQQSANLVLEDLASTMTMQDGSTQTMNAPPMVVQNIQPDGSKQPAEASDAWYLRLIMPLPDRPLALGESTSARFDIPFQANGSLLQTKGTIELTLERYVKVGDHTAALLTTVVSVNDLEVPEEIEGDYSFELHGRGLVVFDIEAGVVDLAQVAAAMTMVVDTSPFPGQEGPMVMHQEHLIEVTRDPGKAGTAK